MGPAAKRDNGATILDTYREIVVLGWYIMRSNTTTNSILLFIFVFTVYTFHTY